MKPVDPAEISALLDGELPADRAEELRCAIAEDEPLRHLYAQLAALDTDFRAYAAATMFRPQLSLARTRSIQGLPLFWIGSFLLVLRLATKSLPAGFTLLFGAGWEMVVLTLVVGLETVVLGLVVGYVLDRLVRASEEARCELLEDVALR